MERKKSRHSLTVKGISIFAVAGCLAFSANAKAAAEDFLKEDENIGIADTAVCTGDDWEPARFAGGDLDAYFVRNMRYPEKALKDKQQASICMFCTIDAAGKLVKTDFVPSSKSELKTEALRLVKSVPEWIPATMKGKPVESTPGIWIYFYLDEKGKPVSLADYKEIVARKEGRENKEGATIVAQIIGVFNKEEDIKGFLALMSGTDAEVANPHVRKACSLLGTNPLVVANGKVYLSGFDWSSVDAASLGEIHVNLNVSIFTFNGKAYDPKPIVWLVSKK